MERTISGRIDSKASIGHNNRKFITDNVDRSRISQNITIVQENIKEVYDEIFGKALGEYNAKQKRSDRRIKNYHEHIYHSRQEKIFHEIIFQIGNRDDTPCESDIAATATRILQEFMSEFQQRNPHIRVFNAVIHLDEETPHLHIDFVPFATEQKRGLSTRNSLSKALEQQGFKSNGKLNTCSKLWIDSEKQHLAEVMLKYGIEWKQLDTHANHLSVLDYKKKQREKEINTLDNKVENAEKLLQRRQDLLSEVENVIDCLDVDYQEKKASIKETETELSQKSAELSAVENMLSSQQMLLSETAEKVNLINDIDTIAVKESKLSDNVKVNSTDFENIKSLAKKQIAAESHEAELVEKINVLNNDNAQLTTEISQLKKENHSLRDKLSSAFSEISKLRQAYDSLLEKFNTVMRFVEKLGLMNKLKEMVRRERDEKSTIKTHKR